MIELGTGQSQTPAAAGEHVKDVSEATFMQDVVEASQEVPVIVDFWAPWCGPCKTVGPMLEEIADELGDDLVVAKVNVDDSPETAARMGIRSIPTLALFREGGVVARQTGAGSLGQLRAFVKGNL